MHFLEVGGPGDLRSIHVRGRETSAQHVNDSGRPRRSVALRIEMARSAVADRRYRAGAFKAGIDLMNFFLYKCGGERGIAAGDEVLPQTRAALPRRRRRLVGLGFADSAAIIHST